MGRYHFCHGKDAQKQTSEEVSLGTQGRTGYLPRYTGRIRVYGRRLGAIVEGEGQPISAHLSPLPPTFQTFSRPGRRPESGLSGSEDRRGPPERPLCWGNQSSLRHVRRADEVQCRTLSASIGPGAAEPVLIMISSPSFRP